ncbi:MAG: prepilin-type N-terminal cleavage/methylation domain-containing protein [Planctomycetes bacterium]|nr:prepilin-type N-terminal cleavage/methylation domain-containing protein [Planctomycetota bacterium]
MRNAECGMRNRAYEVGRPARTARCALRTPRSTFHTSGAGFTLIELLIVMGIIAVLASMLLPAMFAVSQEGRVAEAKSLLGRIEMALNTYAGLYTYHPPDRLPVNAQIYNFQGTKSGGAYVKVTLTTLTYSPETLYYYLCHRFLHDGPPLLTLSGTREMTDTNGNGVPEVVDPWDRPFLYNRPQFPASAAADYNDGINPYHNPTTYDLYGVGPDGTTGDQELLPFSYKTFADFCTRAVNDFNDGHKDDDVRNWSK